MRTTQVLIIGAGLAAVWVTSAIGGARDDARAHAATSAVANRAPATNAHAAQPTAARTLERPTSIPAPPPAPAASPPVAREIPDELEAEREAQQFQAYFTRLDALREREGRDLALEQQVERMLDSATERLRGSHIEQIACSGTLCRVSAQHDDLYARRLFLTGLHHSVGPLLPEASIFVPPTGLTTVAYFARAGHSLPPQ